MEQLKLPFSLRDKWKQKIVELRKNIEDLDCTGCSLKHLMELFDDASRGNQEDMLKNVALSFGGHIHWRF